VTEMELEEWAINLKKSLIEFFCVKNLGQKNKMIKLI
jgi:hypothetical protein